MKRKYSRSAVAAALVVMGFGGLARGQTYTWTGAANKSWNTTSANWSGAGSIWINGNTRDAVFSAGAGTVAVAADITANNISFSTGGWSLVQGATPGTLTLAGTSPGVEVQAGSVTLAVPIISSSMFKTGAGTLRLRSDISGIASVNDGTLDVSGGGTVLIGGLHVATEGKSSTVNVTGAGSVLNPGGFMTVGDSISGSGTGGNGTLIIGNGGMVSIAPTAKLTVGWVNAVGTVSLNADGVLEVGGVNGIQKHASGVSNFILNGGTIRVIGADLVSGVPMGIGTLQQSTIDTNGRNATLSGAIAGFGGLIKSGAGVLTLAGNNGILQGVMINEGVLSVSQDANIGSLGVIGFNGGVLRTTAGFSMDRSINLFSYGRFDVQAGELISHQGVNAVSDGDYGVDVTGVGTLSIKNFRTNGTLTVSNPRTNILAGRSPDNTSVLGKVVIAPGSRLNLNDQDLVINDQPGDSSLANISALISQGYAGGAWNGTGIMSDVAAANGSTALGYAESANLFGNFPAVFSGRSVDDSAVLVRYTYYGDADLDGDVDINDLYRLATHWQTPNTWSSGDFDYNGSVDAKDLALLARNWQAGVGSPLGLSIEDALKTFALPSVAVPEPALGGMCAVIAAVLCGRRRGVRHT